MALLPPGPFRTSGNQIIDQNGNPVRIASIGWSGGYGVPPSLAGLFEVNWQQTMRDMVRLGFNCVRIHTYDRGVLNNVGFSGFSSSINPDLVGLTFLQVYDKVIDYADVIGLRVIVDSHNNEGGHNSQDWWGAQQRNGLWYDSGGISNGTDAGGNTGTITDALFIQSWQQRAQRWKNKPAILGYDIRNEPLVDGDLRSACTWGDGNFDTDIRGMYQRVGNAIQAIDPNPLIICEGPQNWRQTTFSGASGNAPSGDLTRVPTHPVTLNVPNKVLYSVHEYPSTVNGTGAGPDSGPEYIARMRRGWGFLVEQNQQPIFVGELGTRLLQQSERNWAATIVSYFNGTAAGGPTFTAPNQGVSWNWWVWAVSENNGDIPDFGVLTAWNGGSARPEQQEYWGAMLFPGVTSTPTAPGSFAVTIGTATDRSIALSWSSPSGSSPINYRVEYKLSSSTTYNVASSNLSTTSYTVSGLSPSTSYDFRVVATNSAGSSTSPVKTALTSSASVVAPSAPLSVQAVASSPTQLDVSWSPPTTGTLPISYQVQYQKHSNAPGPIESTNNSIVLRGSGTGIVDASGNTWSINASAQLAVNGTGDTRTTNVAMLAYVNRAIWHLSTTTGQWYSITAPNGNYSAGTATSPLPASPDRTSITAGQNAVITDPSGNTWSIIGSQVGINGSADASSSNVVRLYLLGSSVYYQNNAGNWFSKAGPSAAWVGPTSDPSTVTPGGGGSSSATQVLNYLKSLAGNAVISGQFIGHATGDMSGINAVRNITGKTVGLIGADYFSPGTSTIANTSGNTPMIAHWNAGGLVTVCIHMPNPQTGGNAWDVNIDMNALLTPGTSSYNNYMTMVDRCAVGLQQLKDAGVVVLWRPFHELNGNWFWWGQGTSTQFHTLWRNQYNYYKNTKGLDNLLWYYSVNAMPDNTMLPRYPGNEYVDLVGLDMYTSNPAGAASNISTLATTGKPVSISEFGPGSANSGDPNFSETTLINAIKQNMRSVVFFQQWWERWGIDRVQNASAALNDPYVLNLDTMRRSSATPGGPSTPTPTESADNTSVSTVGPAVVNSVGESFTITSGRQIAVNGTVDATTANVSQIYYLNHVVYHQNTAGNWYSKTRASDPWVGPTTAPTSTGGSTGTPITAPLTGSVTTGAWEVLTYNGTTYGVLAPAQYNASRTYPLMLYMHQFSWGSYGFDYLRTNQLDPWFNTVSWRTNYPCFVVAPLCDQGSNGNDANRNWGGVDGSNQLAQNNAIAIVQQLMNQYPINRSKVYTTGNSMGAIGSWDIIIEQNRVAGTKGRIFTAALIMAGATYEHGGPGSSNGVPPSQEAINAVRQIPIYSIHGAQDTNVPLAFDRAMYASLQPPNGLMKYLELQNYGHDVWDDYYLNNATWQWLFAQQA